MKNNKIKIPKKEVMCFRGIYNNEPVMWRCEVEVEDWDKGSHLFYFSFTLPKDAYCEATEFEVDDEEFCNFKKEFAMQQNEVTISFEGEVYIISIRKIYNEKEQLIAQIPLPIDFRMLEHMKEHAETIINMINKSGQLNEQNKEN